MNKVSSIKDFFPILKKNDKEIIYFDNAATALCPKRVIERMNDYYFKENANVHRGVHYLSQKASQSYESIREKTRAFIQAKLEQEIIFTSGTTESINLVASSFGSTFKENDEIILSYMEHHSNIVPWQILREKIGFKIKIIKMNEKDELDLNHFEELLSSKTKLVSITYCSNSLGTINSVEQIIQLTKEKTQAKVLLDGAQAVCHFPVNVQELDVDFFAFSAHKVYGPTGVGILYGKKELLEEMLPYRGGGDMILNVTFEKTIYNKIPYKFEAGTPNIAGVIGWGEAIDFVNEIGWDFILQQEEKLLNYAKKVLKKLSDFKIVGEAERKVPIFSFLLKDIHAHDIGTLLDDHNIAVRTGHHCNQPLMRHYKIPATSRISLAFYNCEREIDELVLAIKSIQERFYEC